MRLALTILIGAGGMALVLDPGMPFYLRAGGAAVGYFAAAVGALQILGRRPR